MGSKKGGGGDYINVLIRPVEGHVETAIEFKQNGQLEVNLRYTQTEERMETIIGGMPMGGDVSSTDFFKGLMTNKNLGIEERDEKDVRDVCNNWIRQRVIRGKLMFFKASRGKNKYRFFASFEDKTLA